jgi:hypothetical protein
MTVVLLTTGFLGGCAAGLIGDRLLRRMVVRWCRLCGHPVGTVCIECRDRRRANNLRLVRNQRRDLIPDGR